MTGKYSNTNPPPVDFTPPPMKTYASKYPGSPSQQAFARQQAANKAQSALNQQHGSARRRRRSRRHLRGGDPDDPPANHIIVPQSQTGVHQTSPTDANTNAKEANQSLINGRAASQYDSLVQFTPSQGQKAGRRRRRRTRRKKSKKRRKFRRARTRRRRRRRRKRRRRTRRRKKRHRGGYKGGCALCRL